MHNPTDHPWISGNLRIRAEVIAQVDAEARAAYARDEECCGLLLGPRQDALLVDAIQPFKNRANELHRIDAAQYPRTGRTSFDIDPLRVQRMVAEGESTGRPVKVLYHSHVDVDAYFSETDAAAATMAGEGPTYDFAYLVTSCKAGVVHDRKLFIWDPDRQTFVESPHSVVGAPA